MNRGAAAEALAASYLATRGLTIVQRNYRRRGGEIDLIARDGEVLVFVEVRLRRNRAFGTAAESITAAKRRRLRLAARHYLARLGREPPCRFDAVLLDALETENIEWLRGVEGI
jgi:putative endonuclease